MKKADAAKEKNSKKAHAEWELRLYIAGQTRAVQAFKNLKTICSEHLEGKYSIEVIDLLKEPSLARGDQIIAVPTLVRKLPEPIRKIIGDLSDTEKVLVGLDLRRKVKTFDSSHNPSLLRKEGESNVYSPFSLFFKRRGLGR